jgi:hypothetical protein
MDSTDTVVKTAAGVAEQQSRSRKLAPRLRTMLIMIDGSLTVDQLQRAAEKLAVPPDFLHSLEQQGLIALTQRNSGAKLAPAREALPEVDRFRAAQKLMNDTVVDALGFRAFFFTLKLEKCSTRAELLALLPDYVKAMAKGSGDEVARVLQKRARELLE